MKFLQLKSFPILIHSMPVLSISMSMLHSFIEVCTFASDFKTYQRLIDIYWKYFKLELNFRSILSRHLFNYCSQVQNTVKIFWKQIKPSCWVTDWNTNQPKFWYLEIFFVFNAYSHWLYRNRPIPRLCGWNFTELQFAKEKFQWMQVQIIKIR